MRVSAPFNHEDFFFSSNFKKSIYLLIYGCAGFLLAACGLSLVVVRGLLVWLVPPVAERGL